MFETSMPYKFVVQDFDEDGINDFLGYEYYMLSDL